MSDHDTGPAKAARIKFVLEHDHLPLPELIVALGRRFPSLRDPAACIARILRNPEKAEKNQWSGERIEAVRSSQCMDLERAALHISGRLGRTYTPQDVVELRRQERTRQQTRAWRMAQGQAAVLGKPSETVCSVRRFAPAAAVEDAPPPPPAPKPKVTKVKHVAKTREERNNPLPKVIQKARRPSHARAMTTISNVITDPDVVGVVFTVTPDGTCMVDVDHKTQKNEIYIYEN